MTHMDTLLDVAIEQAADAVMITDLGGVIQYVNQAFERTTGYSRAEVVGQHSRMLRSGAHDPAFYRYLWETLTRGQVWRGTLVSRRKDGRMSEAEAIISPVQDDAGRVISYVAVSRDVTHERQRALVQRRREAMTILKAVSGSVAHDVNNLLMSIVGLTEILDSRLSQMGAEFEEVSELEATCTRAASFTRQLLVLGQREVSRPEVIDLNETLPRIEKILRRLVGNGVRVIVGRRVQPAMVRFPPGQLEEMILQMALRARDAMPSGGTFTVALSPKGSAPPESRSTVASAETTGWIEVRVSDTGPGTDPAATDRVPAGLQAWEATYTASQFKERLRRHGGRIVVSRDPDGGTTCALYLPEAADMPPQEEHDPQQWSVPSGAGRGRDREHRAGTVLLAEDEPGVRELVRTGLTRLGYRVLDAPDGATAMETAAFDGGPIDLLITDVVMPGMTGQELADRVVALHPSARVIYMSGYPQETLGDPRLARRHSLFLQKPFTRERLARAVREAFELK